jgi:cytochrome c
MPRSRSKAFWATLGAAALWLGAAQRAQAGDTAHGADVYKAECAECHSVREGKHKKGPSLFGIVGRKAATLDGFAYSDALKGTGWVWTSDQLIAYLSGPVSKTNPGGKMKYDGLRDERARDDLLAYLLTLK